MYLLYTVSLSLKLSLNAYNVLASVNGKVYRKLVMSILNDYPAVKIFNAAEHLCDDTKCYGMLNGKILYRDNDPCLLNIKYS